MSQLKRDRDQIGAERSSSVVVVRNTLGSVRSFAHMDYAKRDFDVQSG